MPLPHCSNCDNWRRRDPGASDGTCRLNPPAIVPAETTRGYLCAWPVTMADDGCRLGWIERLAVALDDAMVRVRCEDGQPIAVLLDRSRVTELLERRLAEDEAEGHG